MRSAVLSAAVSTFNRGVVSLIDSPRWGPLARRRFTVITYVGRRSGRRFSTPVAYRRRGEGSGSGTVDVVTIGVELPERKRWWRNFTGEGGQVTLQLPEGARTGHATAHRGEGRQAHVRVELSPADSTA